MTNKDVHFLSPSISLSWTAIEFAINRYVEAYNEGPPVSLLVAPSCVRDAYQIATEHMLTILVVPVPGMEPYSWGVVGPKGMVMSCTGYY